MIAKGVGMLLDKQLRYVRHDEMIVVSGIRSRGIVEQVSRRKHVETNEFFDTCRGNRRRLH